MKLPVASALATGAVTVALAPLLDGGDWLWSGLGAIIVVSAAMTLGSRMSMPPMATPLAGLGALFVYLIARFASDQAWAVFIPTPSSLAGLGRLMAAGWGDIQKYAAPVPSTKGVTLITTLGIGVIALLVDLLAVRLRRAALAGLPLLALFTVPAAVREDAIEWFVFPIPVAGFIALLIVDGRERVGQWGRPVLVRRSGRGFEPDSTPIGVAGRRIGISAMMLALIIPALLPTLEPSSVFGLGAGGGGGLGGGTLYTPDPLVSLRRNLVLPTAAIALTYRTNAATPPYLRMHSLDKFDGTQFWMTPFQSGREDRVAGRTLPRPQGLQSQSATFRTRISIDPNLRDVKYLPLPYPPKRIDADGDWRMDRGTLMVWSRKDDASGMTYDVESLDVKPSVVELQLDGPLPPEISGRYLQLPNTIPEEIRHLTEQVTKDAQTPYDVALALQEWFTSKGKFKYSLQTSREQSNSALREFLLKTRTGYCQQFAASMAIMARIRGIPARVSVGFTGGTKEGNRYIVRSGNMHAWPELYFHGVGWLRFEPTPAGPSGQASATVPHYAIRPLDPRQTEQNNPQSPTGQTPGATPTGGTGTGAGQINPREREGAIDLTPLEDQGMSPGAKAGIAALVLLVIIAVPSVGRLLTRMRRRHLLKSPFAHAPPGVRRKGDEAFGEAGHAMSGDLAGDVQDAVSAELRDMLYDLGMPREPSESPRALARRLLEQHELDAATAKALARITQWEERARYARVAGPAPDLSADLRTVRRALAATVTRRRRIRATLMPPSTLLRLRQAGGRVLDAFDWLDTIRLRRSTS